MNETTMTTRPDGSREWWVDGRLHRTDGPALEWADGSREWWVDGRLHRTDEPVVASPELCGAVAERMAAIGRKGPRA